MGTRVAGPVLALVLLLPACTGDGTRSDGSPPPAATTASPSPTAGGPGRTFEGEGVSFTYPKDWAELELVGTTASAGNALWGVTVGIDKVNFVSVSAYGINVPVTAETMDEQAGRIARQIEALFQQAGGELLAGPTVATMAGLPALGFTGTARNPNGDLVTSRLVLAFDAATEYFVNCQHDDAGAAEVLAGCDRIVASFETG